MKIVIALLAGLCLGIAEETSDRTKKAMEGDAAAQISLGEMYRLGLGVPQNYGEALRFYKLAAAQGMPEAEFALAEMSVLAKRESRITPSRALVPGSRCARFAGGAIRGSH